MSVQKKKIAPKKAKSKKQLLKEKLIKTQRRVLKEKIKRATQICKVYAGGEYTIQSVCISEGVPYQTFYQWATLTQPGFIPEIMVLYQQAKTTKHECYMTRLSELAKTGLQKRVEGYEYTEKHNKATASLNKDGTIKKLVPIEVRTVIKQVAPDTTAIIFALKNTDPNHFKDKHEYDMGDKTMEGLFDFLRKKGKIDLSRAKAGKPKIPKN